MKKSNSRKRIPFLKLVAFAVAASPLFVSAQMSSTNYRIDADVFGAGGVPSSSSSFGLQDTIGEPIIGDSSSANFSDYAGFQQEVNTSLSMTIDNAVLDLGSVTPGSPINNQSVLTVTTDAWGGYDLYANEDHPLRASDLTTIADYSCAVASPCAWTGQGFGFTLTGGTGIESKWGTSPDYAFAAFPTSSTLIHTKAGFQSSGDETTVGYRLDVPLTQKSGVYGNMITYTVMSKL